LSVISKYYSIIQITVVSTLTWFIQTFFVVNKNPFTFFINLLTTKHVSQVKIDFFTSFFKNFLVWNYILTSQINPNIINITLVKSQIQTKSLTLTNISSKSKYKNILFSNNNLLNLNLTTLTSLYYTFLHSETLTRLKVLIYKSFSFSWYYINGFVFILFIDACLTDDEPLWEPIEWSLVQTWILFIFSFAWIAENLIVSRYGSYAGRDKRVWMAWYKTFWLIEGYYVLNYGVAVVLVMVPFYFELNYNLSFVYSWWNWFSKVFFFKFTLLYSTVLLISLWLQINIRWVGFKKALFLISVVNIILGYLIYTQFIIIFFGYFTDPVWYQKTRYVDYVQLSHEPAKWGWGSSKKDHFTYHGVRTVLWFKNDGPFATSFLFCQIFFFICLFCLFIYWIVLFRRVYSLSEVPITYTTYCISSLKQFFFFFFYFYIFILLSFLSNYWRFPIEYFFYMWI